jgi:hypothetical protein
VSLKKNVRSAINSTHHKFPYNNSHKKPDAQHNNCVPTQVSLAAATIDAYKMPATSVDAIVIVVFIATLILG